MRRKKEIMFGVLKKSLRTTTTNNLPTPGSAERPAQPTAACWCDGDVSGQQIRGNLRSRGGRLRVRDGQRVQQG